MKRALILVDIQNDFIPGGALPAKEGHDVVPVANELMQCDFDLVIATRDWHPSDHKSFASNQPGRKPGEIIKLGGTDQILWPDHCVQGSEGAEFHPDLDIRKIDHIVYKGTNPEIDSYSTFFDNAHLKSTALGDFLQKKGVTDVYIAGLATDYCVKFSVLDALDLGFRVHVVEDGCRGVELRRGDASRAIDEMRGAGAEIVTSDEIAGKQPLALSLQPSALSSRP